MTAQGSRDRNEAYVNFEAPAGLHRWPSLKNERRPDRTGPYLIVDATLNECISEFTVSHFACSVRPPLGTEPRSPY
jgi:hypothetical protein